VTGGGADDPGDYLAQAVADAALGLGLGATGQARRWALIGKAVEEREQEQARRELEQAQSRRPAHRPKVDPLLHLDALRAYAAWDMCQNLRRLTGKPSGRVASRELIRVLQLIEKELGVPLSEQMFPTRKNLEASVSRGKVILQIDADWDSEFCEKLSQAFGTFPKETP
jgi:hypothetical protein